MKKILAVIFLGVLLAGAAQADIIRLKDGSVVEGRIIKEGRFSVRMEVGGVNRSFGKDQIEQIDRGRGLAPEAREVERRALTEIPREKVDLILRLLRANGTEKTLRLAFQKIIAKAPLEAQAYLTQRLQAGQILDLVVPVYDSYFSTQEVRELLVFYSSPTGRKYISVNPRIVEQTMVEAAAYFQQQVPGARD